MFDKDLPESIVAGPAAHDDDQRPGPLPRRAVEVQVRPARQVRHLGQRAAAAARPRSSTTWPSSRSVHTEAINHDPAVTYVCTGNRAPRPAEPRLVAQLRPGQRERQPARVRRHDAVVDRPQATAQALYTRLWGTGFLPSKHQGVALRSQRRPGAVPVQPRRRRRRRPAAACSTRSAGSTRSTSTRSATRRRRPASPSTRWPSACRRRVPELIDLVRASRKHVLDLYGPDVHKPGTFAAQLPAGPPAGRARRALRAALPPRLGPARQRRRRPAATSAATSTRPATRLITDLKQRGLLDDTLVVWGGEFGRTVYCQGTLTARQLRPRPPPALLLHVDGRRRRQAAASSTARPTTSATTSSRTPSTSTT